MDVNRLRQGEKIAAASAIALLLIMFIFDWFGVSAKGGGGPELSPPLEESARQGRLPHVCYADREAGVRGVQHLTMSHRDADVTDR